jgi:hypothetical protein
VAITNSFRKAVEDGDVKDIRIMLKESLLVDPTFSEFEEKSHYSRTVSGVYVRLPQFLRHKELVNSRPFVTFLKISRCFTFS